MITIPLIVPSWITTEINDVHLISRLGAVAFEEMIVTSRAHHLDWGSPI